VSVPLPCRFAYDLEPRYFAELKQTRALGATLSHQYRGVGDVRTWPEDRTEYFKRPKLAVHGDSVEPTTKHRVGGGMTGIARLPVDKRTPRHHPGRRRAITPHRTLFPSRPAQG
jgi:hypothetical protein